MLLRSLIPNICLTIVTAACIPTTADPTIEPAPVREPVQEIRRAVTPTCQYTSPSGEPVLDHEMIITDLSVVNDPCRTSWTGKWGPGGTACPTGSVGAWTFKYLILEIAHGDAILANQMVSQWLASWTDPLLMINGQLLNEFRTVYDDKHNLKDNVFTRDIIKPWRKRSGCDLDVSKPCLYDLEIAPFRLLAIVNRVDMAGLAGYVFDPSSGASSGEGRFIFGFVRLDDPFVGQNLERVTQATAIFEYRLPVNSRNALDGQRQWATQWHELSSLTLPTAGTAPDPTATYNLKLQALTDRFVRRGVDSAGANIGSAFSQLRTNEQDFDSGDGTDRLWELREHTLQASQGVACSQQQSNCLILPSVTKQTPSNGYQKNVNATQTLTDFFLENKDRIKLESYDVPPLYLQQPLLAAVSRFNNSPGISQDILDIWTLTDNKDRYDDRIAIANFAFGTCNGCHYAETRTDGFHIRPRHVNEVSSLSAFVSGATNLQDPRAYKTSNGTTRETLDFNEVERRKCEIRRLLRGVGRPQLTPTGATRSH